MKRLTELVAEQLTEIRTALDTTKNALLEQTNLGDEVQSQAATNGVANETRFYREG